MRKLILLYVIFQLIYSVTNAQIKLLDFISPAAGATNPRYVDSLGKGGHMVVSAIVDSIYKLGSQSLDNSILT